MAAAWTSSTGWMIACAAMGASATVRTGSILSTTSTMWWPAGWHSAPASSGSWTTIMGPAGAGRRASPPATAPCGRRWAETTVIWSLNVARIAISTVAAGQRQHERSKNGDLLWVWHAGLLFGGRQDTEAQRYQEWRCCCGQTTWNWACRSRMPLGDKKLSRGMEVMEEIIAT